MTTQLRIATLLSFAFACTRAGEPAQPPADRSGPLEIEFGDRILAPSAFAPHPSDGGFAYEPDKVGWSRDSGEFMVCVPYEAGSECHSCYFHRLGAEPEHVYFGDAADQTESGEWTICDQPYSALEHRLAVGDHRIEDGEWAYGADVVLVVAMEGDGPDNEGSSEVVKIGARLRSEGASVAWLDHVEDSNEGGVHIDAIAPSPDGQTIAVFVHTWSGEGFDTYPVRLLDARTLADAAAAK
jgi:hypothetical protein